jgi:hypothetical protein
MREVGSRWQRWRVGLFRGDAIGWRLTIAIIISLVLPLIIHWVTGSHIPAYAAVLLAMGWFCAASTGEIVIVVSRIYRQRQNAEQLWDTHDQLDAVLSNMRKSLRTIVGFETTDEGLFRTHFRRRLSDLDHELSRSAESRSLEVASSHLERAGLVLNEFAGKGSDEICAVHSASDNSEFADHLVQEWFQRVYDLTQAGRIFKVRRLILIGSDAERRDPLTELLINFHHTNDRYECRMLSKAQFTKSIEDFRLSVDASDFALYGGHYVFLGKPIVDGNRTGVWSNDPDLIRKIQALFDNSWRAPAAERLPRMPSIRRVTANRIFEFARARYGEHQAPGPSERSETRPDAGPVRTRRRSWRFWPRRLRDGVG